MASSGFPGTVAAALPEECDDVRSQSNVDSLSSCTCERQSSPASFLGSSGPVTPQLQSILNWLESPSLQADPDWNEFPLEPKPFFEQLYKLEYLDSLCGQRIRYDYSEADEILALRMMPSRGHEVIVSRLRAKISQGLKDSATQNGIPHSSREFALIPNSELGSADVKYWSPKFEGKRQTRSPDAQFHTEPKDDPSLVIEVAWTQSRKNLQQLAYDYILGTKARVRTVVGFDVDVSAGRSATVLVWRAVHNENQVAISCEVTEIRNKSGIKNSDPQAGLRLTLEDFAYDRNSEEYPGLDAVVIFIPVDDLYDMLERADDVHRRETR